jgi:hypothetical protein
MSKAASDRYFRAGLLASTSLAALLIGGGMPAWAACTSVGGSYTNSGSISGICVTNTSFTGNIDNSGTISPSGSTINVEALTKHVRSFAGLFIFNRMLAPCGPVSAQQSTSEL